MKSLIIGKGEIGKSLWEVIGGIITDKEYVKEKFDIIHICFPYSKDFIKEVKRYQKLHQPTYTVIHSTVPVGISKKLRAIHSPCLGIHPHLAQSLTTFTKFLGGEKASEVADYFRRFGIKVYITDKSETTEFMKIMDTTQYGIEIEFTKEIKRLCDAYKIPFEMWSVYVNNYNQGYEKLGYPEYKKYNLVPIKGKIGGHCVTQNAELIDSKFAKLLRL
jgi:hypothetical protein